MVRFGKKEQSAPCRDVVEKNYQMQDPMILHAHELNNMNAKTD